MRLKIHFIFLEKIDNDIVTSKKILNNLESADTTTPEPTTITTPSSTTEIQENTTVGEVQRLIILLDNEEQKTKNRTHQKAWPDLDEATKKEPTEKTTENLYPWNKKPPSFSKEKEFTFHRVTGKPLHYRSNVDKTTARNAYVAVSVIGTKNDKVLEDQLHQLKPWNHQDNLNRMETLRKRWFLQPDRQK